MAYKAAIITVGDAASRGGAAAAEMLQSAGFEIIYTSGVPAERDTISAELIKCEYEPISSSRRAVRDFPTGT